MRSKASIEKQIATRKANREAHAKAQPVCDVQSAILSLRSIRVRMVKDIVRGALKYPNADHIDALNALIALQGRG